MGWHRLSLAPSPACHQAVVGAPLGLLLINWCWLGPGGSRTLMLREGSPCLAGQDPAPVDQLSGLLLLPGGLPEDAGDISSLSPPKFSTPGSSCCTLLERRPSLHPFSCPSSPTCSHPEDLFIIPTPCPRQQTRRPGDGRSTSQVREGPTGGLQGCAASPGPVWLYEGDTWRCVPRIALSHTAPAGDIAGSLCQSPGAASRLRGIWGGGGARYLLLPGQGDQRSQDLPSHPAGKRKGGDAPINYTGLHCAINFIKTLI